MIDTTARLFVGVFPSALVFADKERTESGDWQRIASIDYSTVLVHWNPQWTPTCEEDDALVAAIYDQLNELEQRIGQEYQVSTTGQTVVLGSAIPG